MSNSLKGTVFHIYGLGLQKAQDLERQIKSKGGRTSLVFGHNVIFFFTTPIRESLKKTSINPSKNTTLTLPRRHIS